MARMKPYYDMWIRIRHGGQMIYETHKSLTKIQAFERARGLFPNSSATKIKVAIDSGNTITEVLTATESDVQCIVSIKLIPLTTVLPMA